MNEKQHLTANSFTREGYTFMQWNERADSSGISYPDQFEVQNLTDTPNGTVTLYAQWARNCTVCFDANGGTGAMADQTFAVGIPQNLTPNAFSREGYAFTGWNTRADGTGTAFTNAHRLTNELAPYDAAVTLYAQWKVSNTVHFDANGGTGAMADQTFTDGIPQNLAPNAFSRQGYRFAGWTSLPDGTGEFFDDGQNIVSLTGTPGAAVTLYARWIASIIAYRTNADGKSVPTPDCLPISSDCMPAVLSGNYYISESVCYDRPIRFTGTTLLILGENCVMNVGTENNPITDGEAAIRGTGDSTLLIFREKASSGQLNVYAAGRPAISIPEGFLSNVGSVYASSAGNSVRTVNLSSFFQTMGAFSVSAGGDHAAALYAAKNFEVNGGEVSASAAGTGAAAVSALSVTVNGGTIAASANGDASAAISGSGTVVINGGRLSAVAEGADAVGLRGGSVHLGWSDAWNSVMASSYDGAVTIADGQYFRGSGSFYSGQIANNSAIACENLTPANIIISCGQGGSVTGDTYCAAENETVALTVTPEESCVLESLTVKQDETDVELDENNCFTMPAGTVTVTAVFAEKRYQIHADGDARWEIQIAGTAREGERVSFTAEISSEYWGAFELTDVTVTDADGNRMTVEDDAFIMPGSDVLVRPVFAPMISIAFEMSEYVNVMMVQTDSHSWDPGDARALEGETVRFEPLSCDDRFEIGSVTVTAKDGARVACEHYSEYYEEYDFTDTGWRFIMPDSPVTVRIFPAFGNPDFTLPADLRDIGSNAFEGDPLITAVDARYCTSVGAEAFKDCESLVMIRLAKECVMDPTAFDGCGTVYVYAPAGGAAEMCCADIDNCVFAEETQD